MILDRLPRSPGLGPLALVLSIAGSVPARAQSCFDELELTWSPPQMGASSGFCALDGDTILVGAPGRTPLAPPMAGASGAAHVFVRSGSSWISQGELVASDPDPGDEFGDRVAVSGDLAVVGAPGNAHSGGTPGSAYVFTRSMGVWSVAQRIDAPMPADGDDFGASVAIYGDWIAVGAPEATGPMGGSGAVFLYDGTMGWSHDSTLWGEGSGDDFGSDVALDDGTLIVGAPGNVHAPGVPGHTDRGAAYAFTYLGGGWALQQKLTASDAANGDYFGWPVALAGDTAVVGAPEDDPAGSAYVFVRDMSGVWSQGARLVAQGPILVGGFGEDVAIGGGRILVGAAPDSTPGPGAAYLFEGSGPSWEHVATLRPVDSEVDDFFGASVAVSADRAVVGAPGTDDGGVDDAGKAYAFEDATCTSFCASLPNATGSAALLSASGSTAGSLVLTSSPVPNTPGLFFYGPMMLAGGSSLGDGLRCVGGATTRTYPFVQAGMMMQPPNAALFAVDYGAPYAAGLTGTQYFQHWFRSGLATGTGSNTSDALEIAF